MEVLQICVSITIVLTALGGLVVFSIVRPLNESQKNLQAMITDLRSMINELRVDIKATSGRLNRLEGEVRELHHAVQKAHDRLDALPKMVTAHEKA